MVKVLLLRSFSQRRVGRRTMLSRGRIFRISGVPGSGKTTITALLLKRVQEADGLFRCVNTRQIQCELAGVGSERQYREIPEEKRRELFPHLVQKITEIADSHPEQVWFFERHLCSMDDEGVIAVRGIPEGHGGRTVGLALILAHERQIALWRRKDKKVRQDRHLLSATQIAEEQIREAGLAAEAGQRWGFPVRLFFNRSGCSEKVADEIFAFMKGVVG